MSTIVAVLSKAAPTDEAVARRMLQAAPHRGTHCCVRTFGSCTLGISNPDETGDAGLAVDDTFAGAFLGKLDNASEVCTQLKNRGFPCVSSRPADIVLAAFRALGIEAPNHFRGAFSGVITDGSELWCFRDHLGLEPLFLRDEPRRFYAATEAKQILVGSGIPREPNMDVLKLLFYNRMTRRTPSALKGIERLPKTTILTVGADRMSEHQYWNPAKIFETSKLSADEIEEGFSEVFRKSISRMLSGKDAISLSGGIDSPGVAAYAAPLHKQLMGYSIGAVSTVYPQFPRVDERRYIELIAKYLEIDLHMFTPEAGPWDDVSHWCAIFDGPIHIISLPEVTEFYKTARQLGFTGVFTGDLAEAVFDLDRLVTGHLLMQHRWKALLTRLRQLRQRSESTANIAQALMAPFIPGRFINWYLHASGRNFPARIPHWLEAAKVNEVVFRPDLMQRGKDRYAWRQLRPFLEGTTMSLEADNVCASLCGVTVRRPFADVDVCEFFLSLPAELKYPVGKSKTLMRRILRGKLPDEILDRRDKTVFDDYIMAKLNYASLKQYLTKPSFRIPGVDYEALATRIDRQDLKLVDYIWVNELVRIHAFLSLW